VATVHGRSERTQRLARGLELLPALEDVVVAADVVVDICPPGEAEACLAGVLEAVAATGARPLLADLNALAPGLVRELESRARAAGVDLVDGSISGGPPQPSGETMLYLSGARAAEIARLPADGLRRRVVGREVGVASAVKMCTASVYKGTTALWIQALETAQRHGVADVVLDDLAESFPDEVAGAARRVALAVSKSDRFVSEMEQIAMTQAEAGASGELFDGIATAYRRLSRTDLAGLAPEEAKALTHLGDVLRRLSGT
jgi:3-hydroxyisobutyrate dehydrogenase-like beta-hydroxyacid dehydrogenase